MFSFSGKSLSFTIGPGFALLSPHHNSSFDNKINNTSSIIFGKIMITNKKDEGEVR